MAVTLAASGFHYSHAPMFLCTPKKINGEIPIAISTPTHLFPFPPSLFSAALDGLLVEFPTFMTSFIREKVKRNDGENN